MRSVQVTSREPGGPEEWLVSIRGLRRIANIAILNDRKGARVTSKSARSLERALLPRLVLLIKRSTAYRTVFGDSAQPMEDDRDRLD